MLIRVDETSETPLHEQISAGVRRAIIDEQVREGDRLPPARELAHILGVNMHTVLRAYNDLRDEGMIELRQGRGARVMKAVKGRAKLGRLTAELVKESRRQGLTRDALLDIVKEAYR